MKLKCDFQEPCGRCRMKSLTCKYTRDGYIDPYQEYRVESGSGLKPLEMGSSTPNTSFPLDFVSNTVAPMDLATASDKAQPASWQQNGIIWSSQGDLSITDSSLSHLPANSSCPRTPDIDRLDLNPMPTDFMFDINDDPAGNLSSAFWFSEPLGQFRPSIISEDFFGLAEGAVFSQSLWKFQKSY
jgi:hypothetical protein